MSDLRAGDPLERIESARKVFKRGGDFLQTIFSKDEKFLTKEDCMKLYNTYAIPPFYLTLLAISHDFAFDEEGFCKNILVQKERMLNVKQCAK